MEVTIRLLRSTPIAGDDGLELQEPSQEQSNPRPSSKRKGPKKSRNFWISTLTFYILTLAIMLGHLAFFNWLDGKPARNQGLQSAFSNIFAVFVDITLLGGLGHACNQILWRLLNTKKIPIQLTKTLVDLSDSPWDLWRFKVLRSICHIKRVWFVSLVCAMIPFALIFPPGGMTIEFENQLKTKLHNVKTMNISDIGIGTIRSFVEHSLFQMHADLVYNPTELKPQLRAIAIQVLASGEPVRIGSPCGSACIYNISLEGPTFHCVEPETKPAKCHPSSPIYAAADMGSPHMIPKQYDLLNNAFSITWDPWPDPKGCDARFPRRSLICRMKLSTYTLEIEHSPNASRSIKTKVDNHRDVWTRESPLHPEFFRYFTKDPKGNSCPEPTLLDELYGNFSTSQAFAIRQAATSALQGMIIFESDSNARYFSGNASQVLGSPYIGLNDKYAPHIHMSAESIERFLQDIVISTLSIGMSTHEGDIEAMEGTDVYRFTELSQFYIPYGFCALVALLINAYGALCWYQNKESASPSKTLDEAAQGR